MDLPYMPIVRKPNFILCQTVGHLFREEREAVMDYIEEEIMTDKNLHSLVPDQCGWNPIEWPDDMVDRYLADNHESTYEFVIDRLRWTAEGDVYILSDPATDAPRC